MCSCVSYRRPGRPTGETTAMRIKNHKDFWAGVMFIAFGAFFTGFGT